MRCATCGGERGHDDEFCSTCGSGDGGSSRLEADLAEGTILGRDYEIGAPLAAGGMGVVYRGTDHQLARPVAIKVLPSRFNSDAGVVERFHGEAKAIAAIAHPNIVPIYSVGSDDDVHYFVMKLIEGVSVAELLRDGPVDVAKGVGIALQICDGLAAVHAAGCVHRDVKASNVMVESSGHVTLLDFGVLRDQASDRRLTRTGLVVGTPHYMAPEQVRDSRQVDARSDIYALGVLLYEMLTGKLPFLAPTAFEIMVKQTTDRATEPCEVNPRVSASLSRVIMRALEKDKRERFQTATELKAALLQSGQAVLSGSAAPVALARFSGLAAQPIPFPRKRFRAQVVVATGVLVVIVAAFVVASAVWNEPSVPAPVPAPAPAPAPASASVPAPAPAPASRPRPSAEARPRHAPRPGPGPSARPTPSPGPIAASAPARTPAPPPVSAPTSATLTIVALEGGSFSWADVSVDGSAFAATPVTRKLAAGPHRIDWRRTGFRSGSVKVVLEAGESLRYPVGLIRESKIESRSP